LLRWLDRTGFRNARVVDVTATTTEEQRSTDWMRFNSLQDFLDPDDPSKTLEGYPGPLRATVLADKP
jgi:tRNA (mo5U34)-methyltransferase